MTHWFGSSLSLLSVSFAVAGKIRASDAICTAAEASLCTVSYHPMFRRIPTGAFLSSFGSSADATWVDIGSERVSLFRRDRNLRASPVTMAGSALSRFDEPRSVQSLPQQEQGERTRSLYCDGAMVAALQAITPTRVPCTPTRCCAHGRRRT